MSGGAPLISAAFADFQLSQGRAQFTADNFIRNEVTRVGYTLPHFIDPGNEVKMSKMLQGGSDIRDQAYLDKTGVFESYRPNPTFSYSLTNGLAEWVANWRFSRGEMVWTDHEIGLNTGQMNVDAMIHKFKDVLLGKRMNSMTSFIEGLDDQFWAVPDQTKMESATGLEPYSLPCFINEYANGLPAAANQPGGTWTTIEGLSPVTYPNWKCQRFGYSTVGAYTAAGHLFDAFKQAFYKLNFHKLPYRPDLSNERFMPHVIMASLLGHTTYEKAMHQNQDLFVSMRRDSPHYETKGVDGHLNYRGIPMAYIPQMDEAPLYPTTASEGLGIESNASNTTNTGGIGFPGPRFKWVNGEGITKVFHRDRYFYQTPAFRPSAQPLTNVVLYDCWHQNTAQSLRSSGEVYPSAAIT